MKATTGLAIAGLLLLAAALTAQAAPRGKAKVDCEPTADTLVYQCTIELTERKTGTPIDGAKIMVHADMPAMPMAHNFKPVLAIGAGKPGMYHMRIRVEMKGEWVLRLKLSGPLRDQLIVKKDFGRGMDMAGQGKQSSSPMRAGEHGKDMAGSMKSDGQTKSMPGSKHKMGN